MTPAEKILIHFPIDRLIPTEGLCLHRETEEFNAAIAALRGMDYGERKSFKAETQVIISNEFDCGHFEQRYVDLMGDVV